MDVYHVPDDVERDDALRLAWSWLDERRARPRLVIVPVRDSVGHSPVLRAIASRVRTETSRTLYGSGAVRRDSAVAIVWPSRGTLDEVAGHRPAEVLVLPWRTEQSDGWLRAHGSQPVTGGTPLPSPGISDPVVHAGMRDVTAWINLNNNLVQSEDRDYAVLALRTLHEQGHRLDGEELETWALANGWEGKAAARLRTYAEEVVAGKRHRISSLSPRLGAESYVHWLTEATL